MSETKDDGFTLENDLVQSKAIAKKAVAKKTPAEKFLSKRTSAKKVVKRKNTAALGSAGDVQKNEHFRNMDCMIATN